MSVRELPDGFPQIIAISWLTEFSGGLSELLMGNVGVLESGILLYRQKRLDAAERKLVSVLQAPVDTREMAELWLGWIKYEKHQWKESSDYASTLHDSRNEEIVIESYYLSSLLLIKQKLYEEHHSLMNQLKEKIPQENWNFRLSYCYLISLVNLKYWSDARLFLKRFDHNAIVHARYYYKIMEISALVDYAQNDYQLSLDNYRHLKTLIRHPAFQYNVDRNIAWLSYLTGKYGEALKLVEQNIARYPTKPDEELKYLELACLVRLSKWESVERNLEKLPPQSMFYVYSAYQIRSFLDDPNKHEILHQKVSSLKYRFPEMKFHIALKDGNRFLENGRSDKAERQYLRAMSVDTSSRNYWMAQYNLGLCHLKQGEFEKAKEDFVNLLHRQQNKGPKLLPYHLLYAYYQTSRPRKFMDFVGTMNPAEQEKPILLELNLMKGGVLLGLGKNEQAVKQFMWVWNHGKNVVALEYAAKAYYADGKFQRIIELVHDHPEVGSDILFTYEIKSLLAIRKFEEALSLLEKRSLKGEHLIQLRIEVWLANHRYHEIIARISPLLNNTLSKEKRLLYYLSLGDAYFNLQKYSESKNQFYKALKLTFEIQEQSLILYNIALTTYYYRDYVSFVKEINLILQRKKLSDEIRYNLTQLLVDYYQQNNQTAKADLTLKNYIENNEYQKSKAHIKRIRLLYRTGESSKCFELSQVKVGNESSYHRRDRIIMAGYCGNKTKNTTATIGLLKNELENKKETYRQNEVRFLLAQEYFNNNDYRRSLVNAKSLKKETLNPKVSQETQILLSRNYLRLGNLTEASKELGDVNPYRQTYQYSRALRLKAEIKYAQRKIDDAAKSFLRIYYHPKSATEEKQEVLIRIAEIYLEQEMAEEAKKYYLRLDTEIVLKNDDLKARFFVLQKEMK
ncbi:MAG: tetratricopeptide repeat protein [Proteobacteria bacterium]|nr:tetratricopeptide repeat protein [Pseudomonadota bacterium]